MIQQETLKWHYCMDHECPYCGEVLKDEDYKDQEVVSACKYCQYSFVD